MASLKATVKNDFVKESGKANIKIRLSHGGKTRYISTKYDIEPKFMGRDGIVKSNYPGQLQLNSALHVLIVDYNAILYGLGKQIDSMDINTIMKHLKAEEGDRASFTKYVTQRTEALRQESRNSYASTYDCMIAHLERFTARKEILFKEITVQFLKDFEQYLKLTGCSVNTIRIYLNDIRAVFNHAGFRPSPFPEFKVRQARSRKRSLEVDDIKKLLSGTYHQAQQRAVDIFRLILFLAGINLKDLVYLGPYDYKNGRLTYKRFKTGGWFDIRVYPEVEGIIEKYRGRKYLLDFMEQDDSYKYYKNFLSKTNISLRKAASNAGIQQHISTYFARHSFATLARKAGVSFDDIRQALGHDRGAITDLYIDYDMLRSIVDQAQRKVIDIICT